MPNIFFNIDQQVAVLATKFTTDSLEEMVGNENAPLDLNCIFIKPGSKSTCGFIISSDNFESGGFSVSSTPIKNQYLVTAKGLAKVKVYEMQINALDEQDHLAINSISVKGDISGMIATLPDGVADPTYEFDGNVLVGVKAKIGKKKSDVK